jgi:flagellar biosynthesis/type III secretory pathway protein FliH
MILSDQPGNVVWELNELLAADKRAKAFSKVKAKGDSHAASDEFKVQEWVKIDQHRSLGAADDEPENSSKLADSDCMPTDVDVDVEPETRFDLERELADRYDKGYADGRASADAELRLRDQGLETFRHALETSLSELPPLWPAVTELSLDIANEICKASMHASREIYSAYISSAFEATELPRDVPVNVYISEYARDLLPENFFTSLSEVRDLEIHADPTLDEFDLRLAYGYVSIEKYLQQDIDQLREQLTTQFPVVSE